MCQWAALVKENDRIGTTLLRVTANDDDNGRDGEIRYSIRDGSGLGRFAIDEETGESVDRDKSGDKEFRVAVRSEELEASQLQRRVRERTLERNIPGGGVQSPRWLRLTVAPDRLPLLRRFTM
ncbi:unnamed protein product [Pleuronectes platessa]|uniref:Cadherin domain-containing protein n=1 Tax=Pleuronectes platessa TaxID=8262 RepID=A0A9N7W0E9_PLEPL|nr:unnamed protein product [Pleuronectes platessa]